MTRRGRPPGRKTPEREMTVEDWKAFYLVYQLQEQVALYGKPALTSFIKAMVRLHKGEK